MKQEPFSRLYGQLRNWPTKEVMAELLKRAGFQVYVGRYKIRIEDFDYFIIQQYGEDLGDPQFDTEADSADEMVQIAMQVSEVFREAGLTHRFEIYDEHDNQVVYLHYQWPEAELG